MRPLHCIHTARLLTSDSAASADSRYKLMLDPVYCSDAGSLPSRSARAGDKPHRSCVPGKSFSLLGFQRAGSSSAKPSPEYGMKPGAPGAPQHHVLGSSSLQQRNGCGARLTRGVGRLATKDAGCLAKGSLGGLSVGDQRRGTRQQAQGRTASDGLARAAAAVLSPACTRALSSSPSESQPPAVRAEPLLRFLLACPGTPAYTASSPAPQPAPEQPPVAWRQLHLLPGSAAPGLQMRAWS